MHHIFKEIKGFKVKPLTVKELIVELQKIVDNDELLVATEVGAVADKEIVSLFVDKEGAVVLECRDAD